MSDTLSAEARLRDFSREKTELLKLLLEQRSRRAQVIRSYPRGQGGDKVRLPASWSQQRLWFIEQLEGGNVGYQVPVAVRLGGALDLDALQRALDAVVRRHEVLHTVFVSEEGELLQEIAPEGRCELTLVDLSSLSSAEREARVRHEKIAEVHWKFDLREGPLIRCRLLRMRNDEHILLVTMHHTIADNWSKGLLTKELAALYSAFHKGDEDTLAPLPVQYADYAKWQREWLRGENLDKQLGYWHKRLEGAAPELTLPTDRPRPSELTYNGGNVEVFLNRELSAELRAFAQRHQMTLFMVLFAGWAILLSRLSGQEDVSIGTTIANRQRPEVEGLIGLFANTLVLRVDVGGSQTLAEFLAQIKEVTLGAYDHQDAPFERVVEALRPERSLSRNPLFQTMFALQNAPKSALQMPGLTATLDDTVDEPAVFDLLLPLEERGDVIAGSVNYAKDLFDRQTVERWMACFIVLLRGMVDAAHKRICELPVLGEDEWGRVVRSFNATHSAFPQQKLIHELIEEQVRRTPDAAAVVSARGRLTYAELNSKANQLARYLRVKGVGPDKLVGICVSRGLDMVVGLLGVLKAGGAYVPLDPAYPSDRLTYMLKDAAPTVLLTEEALKASLPETTADILTLDSDWSETARQPAGNLDPAGIGLRSDHLAYVIYTSGSTGQPKGVAIEHRNTVNLICWARSAMDPKAFAQTLQSTSLNFDLAVYECFVPLASGGSIRVVENALVLAQEAIPLTLINSVPSVIQGVLDSTRTPELAPVVNLAGEALKQDLVERLLSQNKVERVCNLYGPSETTTYSTWISMSRECGFVPSIGRPIANTRVYILDRCRQVVPIGVIGEIYIGGAGVARGYLNRPELTAERFLRDPFSSDPQARMYKTGDLGRWLPDGTIEYSGRNDHQVKIRGYRIELGEIEALVKCHEQVKDAAVVAREDIPGEKRLMAYITLRDQQAQASAQTVESLRSQLKSALPEYMLPSAFVVLERMPQTPSGKLDRRALPAPELSAFSRKEYVRPEGGIEEAIASIWQGLLRVERVGRHDNFFELGGHSLLIVQMKDRLRRIGLDAGLRTIYTSATLADLASALTGTTAEQVIVPPNGIPTDCEKIAPEMLTLVKLEPEHIDRIVQWIGGGAANIQDIYPLTPPQEGLLFHHLIDNEGGDTYVMPTLLAVSSLQRLRELIAALQETINRHDVLRTAVLWDQLPQAVQVVCRHVALPVREVALDPDRDPIEQVKEWLKADRQRVDLRYAPLVRLQIAPDRRGEGWFALVQIHHIVCDHMTMEVLISEVVKCLQGRAREIPPAEPYRDHVGQALVLARRSDPDEFFRRKLGDVDESTAPFALMDVHSDASEIREARQTLDLAFARRARALVRQFGVSAATLFHAACGLAVAQTSCRDDVVFGTVLLGRLQGSAGAQRTLGIFNNTLPLRLRLAGVTVRELLEHAQAELVELLGHEQASLANAQRCSGIFGSVPLFTALLNYRHSVPDPDTEWDSAEGVRFLGSVERTNYPITVSIDDLGDGFKLKAQTDPSIDPRRMLGYVSTAVHSLVEALERDPQTPALPLSILPRDEWDEVVRSFNSTARDYPREKLIHELFEQQVDRTPDAIAVEYEERSLTYAELNRKANQLARFLVNEDVGPDKLVGICVGRSLEMVVGLLGILKAGGAYLPLDPNYPAERLRFMVEDAAPAVVLTCDELKGMLPQTGTEPISLDAKLKEIQGYVAENLAAGEVGVSPRNLVYVIFTSGSTGRPKGTAMPHRSMTNLIEWHRDVFGASEGRRVMQFAALSFDVAFQETFSTLCTGGTLVLVREWVRRNPQALHELLSARSVERLFIPPMMLQSLAEYAETAGRAPTALRDIIAAGEQLHITPQVAGFISQLDGCRLHNHYGPTETHVVTALSLEGNPVSWPAFPAIGRPISNAQIYVLDVQRRPVPIGVKGEIYIGGAGVARGYLNRADLTEQRFIPDPFSADPQARLYKTGDVGRWRTDGVLEYLGRNDDQVKIRGFRIELGEVEAQLARHEQVGETIVLAREDVPGDKRLVAYVTLRGERAPNAEELRAHVTAALPEYMVPSAFVVLESLPLTPNGKLDRRALPAPQAEAYVSRPYEAPQGEVEQTLAEIWQQLLRVERIGRNDNFFELGGHSLHGMKLITKVAEKCRIHLAVISIFKYPTVAQMAEVIETLQVVDGTTPRPEGAECEEGIL